MSKQTEVTYNTISAATQATGLSRHTVAAAKKERPDIVLTTGGRLRLAGICEWLRQRSGKSESDALERLRRARAAREELRLKIEDGRAYDAGEIDDRMTRVIARMQLELRRRLVAVVPGEGAHLSARELLRVLENHYNSWCDYCQRQADTLQKKSDK